MKILVTGGAGFIASHIVDELLISGHEVAIVDSITHGKTNNINVDARFYEMDIRSEKILGALKEFKPEVIIHNAAQISVPKSIANPLEDASVNILGSINVLEAAKQAGVRKIIYPASAAIFGQPSYLPIDEAHPLNMISGYGVTKHTVEHYLSVYKELYGMEYFIMRYSNVYGPRQDSSGEGGVVSIFSEKLIKGERPYIYGDGEQIRDFIYVKDIVKANIVALETNKTGIYNVCTCHKTTVNQLYKIINDLLGKNIEPIYAKEREGDIRDSYMSYKKIFDEIGWKPKYDINQGIAETLESML